MGVYSWLNTSYIAHQHQVEVMSKIITDWERKQMAAAAWCVRSSVGRCVCAAATSSNSSEILSYCSPVPHAVIFLTVFTNPQMAHNLGGVRQTASHRNAPPLTRPRLPIACLSVLRLRKIYIISLLLYWSVPRRRLDSSTDRFCKSKLHFSAPH